ncbi:hypothetical protein QTP88_002854 [Uroleucon formosanum]
MLHKQTHLYVHILYIKVEVAVIEEKRWLVGGGGGDGVSDGGGYNRLMFEYYYSGNTVGKTRVAVNWSGGGRGRPRRYLQPAGLTRLP